MNKECRGRNKKISLWVDEKIKPYANEWDLHEKIPDNIFLELAKNGYLTPFLPEKWGGPEMDMSTIGMLCEELGRGCSSVRSLMTVHGMVTLAIYKWGTNEQKSYWLPKLSNGELKGAFALSEPSAGSDIQSIETTAQRTNGGFVLNGHKKWVSFGQVADVYLVFGKIDGNPSVFLVEKDRPGLEMTPIFGVLGTRASMMAEIRLLNCHIPKENMLAPEGAGLSFVATSCLDYGRFTIACGCVGIAQGCLDECLKYTNFRKASGKYLKEHQLIQQMITRMVTEIKAARLLYQSAAHLKDINDPNGMDETWIAKYYASRIATSAAGDAVQIHGAKGFTEESHVQRYFRDAKVMEIIEGTTQLHEQVIALNAFR